MQDSATIYIFMRTFAVYHFLSELNASPGPLVAQQPFSFHATFMVFGFQTDVMLRRSPRQLPLS
jgi:hypothetical protein